MAFSSLIDCAKCSADYWKQHLTLEETVNLFFLISLLNSCSYCVCIFTITLILLGKGGFTEESGTWAAIRFLLSILSSTFLLIN